MQLAKLSGDVDFFTALGDDERGRRSAQRLSELGVRVHAAPRAAMQRWGFVHLTDDGERTISIVGERHAPRGDDDLPWDRLDGADAVLVSGGDHAAMVQARRAQVLVATACADVAGIDVDALVGSANDRLEHFDAPRAARGRRPPEARAGPGRAAERNGTFAAAELPGPLVDSYGAGDTFAGGLTYALGAGFAVDERRSRSPPAAAPRTSPAVAPTRAS